MSRRQSPCRQRGVAVITALLLTTLAVTIVASLFWQQQVQVRSIENQRLHLQTKWILRGALDWGRLILREDAKFSTVDHLGEPWAVSLAETRLDQYVENARADSEQSDATLSGHVVDAQSRFNLGNLSANGTINKSEVAVFGRLLRLGVIHLVPNLPIEKTHHFQVGPPGFCNFRSTVVTSSPAVARSFWISRSKLMADSQRSKHRRRQRAPMLLLYDKRANQHRKG